MVKILSIVNNGKLAAESRIEKGSTTIWLRRVGLITEVPSTLNGKEIVQSLQKYKVVTRCDVGMIALSPTTDDLAKVEEIVEKIGCYTPNMKISVYKNRRGRYKGIYVWCYADLGTCRVKPLFITDYHHSIQTVERTTIIVK